MTGPAFGSRWDISHSTYAASAFVLTPKYCTGKLLRFADHLCVTGDMGYDVLLRRRGARLEVTVPGVSLCASERLTWRATVQRRTPNGSHK